MQEVYEVKFWICIKQKPWTFFFPPIWISLQHTIPFLESFCDPLGILFICTVPVSTSWSVDFNTLTVSVGFSPSLCSQLTAEALNTSFWQHLFLSFFFEFTFQNISLIKNIEQIQPKFKKQFYKEVFFGYFVFKNKKRNLRHSDKRCLDKGKRHAVMRQDRK